jgi:hypothetical protein
MTHRHLRDDFGREPGVVYVGPRTFLAAFAILCCALVGAAFVASRLITPLEPATPVAAVPYGPAVAAAVGLAPSPRAAGATPQPALPAPRPAAATRLTPTFAAAPPAVKAAVAKAYPQPLVSPQAPAARVPTTAHAAPRLPTTAHAAPRLPATIPSAPRVPATTHSTPPLPAAASVSHLTGVGAVPGGAAGGARHRRLSVRPLASNRSALAVGGALSLRSSGVLGAAGSLAPRAGGSSALAPRDGPRTSLLIGSPGTANLARP